MGSRETFVTIIEKVIDTFQNTTTTVNQTVRKIWKETNNLSQRILLKHLIGQSSLFQLRHFTAQCIRKFQFYNANMNKNDQVTAHDVSFELLTCQTRPSRKLCSVFFRPMLKKTRRFWNNENKQAKCLKDGCQLSGKLSDNFELYGTCE